MTSPRLLRSLSSVSATSSHPPPRSALSPPYTHSNVVPSTSSLRPPYSHTLPTGPAAAFTPAYRFTLLPPSHRSDAYQRDQTWLTWAETTLSTESGRRRLVETWERCILELEKVKQRGDQIPQISFHSLGKQLAEGSATQAIKEKGVVVIRDVVHDKETAEWASSLMEELRERGGRGGSSILPYQSHTWLKRNSALYWHEALLNARSHPSVLSATNQILSALTRTSEEAFIQAGGLQTGAASTARITNLEQPWSIQEDVSARMDTVLGIDSLITRSSQLSYASTPLVSHLALTPSTSTSHLTPNIYAAVYASIRPLFRSQRSMISFYEPSAYFDPANWNLVEPTSTNGRPLSLPHVREAHVQVPILEPGDMLIRHAALPIEQPVAEESGRDQLFLPLCPLPRTVGNVAYIEAQREAFESGMPPPGASEEGVAVAMEKGGGAADVGSSGGRRAMGYGL